MCTQVNMSLRPYSSPLESYRANNYALGHGKFEQSTMRANQPDEDKLHQWPWRGFAFASDLGILALILNKPKLAGIGWLIALPYYGYSILSKPGKEKKYEESVYQVTANGLFPLVEAKLGAMAGGLLGARFPKISSPVCKGAGVLLALAALTPTLGDPISQHIVQNFKIKRGDSW